MLPKYLENRLTFGFILFVILPIRHFVFKVFRFCAGHQDPPDGGKSNSRTNKKVFQQSLIARPAIGGKVAGLLRL